jgi:7-cyano-7-deazaguanine synthase
MSSIYNQLTNVLILTSGGIDSTACLAYYLNKPNILATPLFVDYGQAAANYEFKAVQAVCKHYQVNLETISISSKAGFSKGFITGRNMMLLAMALMFSSYPNGLVALGIHAGTNYFDCTKDFITKMQNLYDLYADGRYTIDTPFIEWSKPDIWQYCIENKVPVDLTYSCESGTKPVCGRCLSCKDIEALYATK